MNQATPKKYSMLFEQTLLCEKRQNPLKFKGKPFVIFVNMKIPENLNENTPPKDFPLKSKGKM